MPETCTVTHRSLQDGYTYSAPAALGRRGSFALQQDGGMALAPLCLGLPSALLMGTFLTSKDQTQSIPLCQDQLLQSRIFPRLVDSLSPRYLGELRVACMTMTRVPACLLE